MPSLCATTFSPHRCNRSRLLAFSWKGLENHDISWNHEVMLSLCSNNKMRALEKFQRGILCPHRDMQQSSLCVQMFYFNMKRHSVIHGIMYTWYEHDKGATDTEAIVSDWKTQLAQRRSPVFTMLRGIVHGKTKVRLHYLLLPLPRPPRGH